MLVKDFKDSLKVQRDLKKFPEEYWLKRGEQMALDLFKEMSVRVPAYKDFLKEHKIDPNTIKTIKDFEKVPLLNKDNYLRKYPLEKLCWDGEFASKHWDISSTSGSTGESFYFPRTDEQNKQYALTAELYLLNNFQIDKKSTLYVNCFALGVWIGGLFNYEAIKMVARNREYQLSIINPGLNKPEIFKSIKSLGSFFDQVIIGGYPPFVKDVVDEAEHYGLKWSDYKVKFVFSAEAFSEDFRDYLYKKTGGNHNIYLDSLNHYGTVDQGTLAHETPLSILVRRLAIKNENLYKDIFGEGVSKLPTLAQYVPEMFYFEERNKSVICSSYSGLPLVRYDLKDHGGVVSFEEMKNIFTRHQLDLNKEIEKVGIKDYVYNLPFVFVYERRDLSVSFSGANVYPETFRRVLDEEYFNNYFTGKFTLLIRHDEKQDPYLEVNIELKKDVALPTLELHKQLENRFVEQLLKENSEYKVIYEDRGYEKAVPRLKFWLYESPEYFAVGGKQKWVIK